jgi:RNA polymerase sigma-70 factor (ECF subfamily)
MSDMALAARVIAGDETAFDEFFTVYFPRLYRFALVRLGGNEDASEEIVQRVLILALDRLHTYKGEAALLTWLCTLCRREIGRWREHEGLGREVSFSDDRPEMRLALESIEAIEADDPDSELQRRELSRLVQTTLDHLPRRYGDVLEWKYIQELSVGEIAERLGVGYKAAESVLTRARAAFRDGFSLVAADWPDAPASRSPRSSEGT